MKRTETMTNGGGADARQAETHGFGPALARARERRRLTRRELARHLEVSHMTVRRWETGVSLPNARHYAALVAVVGPLEHGSLVRFEEVSRRIAAVLSELASSRIVGTAEPAVFSPVSSRARGGRRPPSGCR